MSDRLLTPTKLTTWLDCEHYLTLRHLADEGRLEVDGPRIGSLSRLLMDKGNRHETDCLAEYRSRGLDVFEVPKRQTGEPFADWVGRIRNPLEGDHDVIYQMPFVHDGMRGIADFLVRVEEPANGAGSYEPVDAKLARSDAKPGHLLQLCFYADALAAKTGAVSERVHLWLGSGELASFLTRDFLPYWRRLRTQLDVLVDDDGAEIGDTRPEPCQHCEVCEFEPTCDAQWRSEDSLVYVAGVRPQDRHLLEEADITTLAELAGCAGPVDGIRPDALTKLVDQARLQVEARDDPASPPPFLVISADGESPWGHGLEQLPKPDEGDVFLDFEGDPFWRADSGLFFLFGCLSRGVVGEWRYMARWAHDQAEEAYQTKSLIDWLVLRRQDHPDMHAYHYNHTERTMLECLAATYGADEVMLAKLVETGLFVDLYPVVRNAVQAGTEGYGLKDLEPLTGYRRGHDIDRGAAAVVEYERYLEDGDPSILERIASYNEDDVRSTLDLRDWLVGLRPAELEWRAAVLDADEGNPDLDAQVAALHAFGPGTPEHLLGDLLGYWRRELRANGTQKLIQLAADPEALLDDPDVVSGLEFLGTFERIGKKGQLLRDRGAKFRWPEQELSDPFGGLSSTVVYGEVGGPIGWASIDHFDRSTHELVLTWSKRAMELGILPTAVVADGWVRTQPKPDALSEFATQVIGTDDPGAPNRASRALLARDRPVFTDHGGPSTATFTDDLDAMVAWVRHLDGSYLAIQGPPGTGKTYRGAHLVHELVASDPSIRVGVTAMSHLAIDNLLEEIVKVFDEAGDWHLLKALRKGAKPAEGGLPGFEYTNDSANGARGGVNLVAGTTWLFANRAMRSAPVDVLLVDEAGQLSLADTLAASTSASNLVLLGDPLQLPQVSQASHPGGAGASVLEHVLGDDVTLPADRGVFLEETRRMHPDVCRYISEQIYDGRLRSHPSCARQGTAFGTGLRWLRAEHDGRSTESPEEAALIAAQIERLLGTPWTDQEGTEARLGVGDVMVVVPYNDQVRLVTDHLDSRPRTRGVRVGTVDKFQGREAAVVFFSMTTSASDDMTRAAEFLFSRNRLNVAVSRARCLAYLVCTEQLLDSRARDVEEMRLMAALCAFVEHCA